MKIAQAHFHPMRGHIHNDAEILTITGETLRLKATINGWQLFREDGAKLGSETPDAYEITREVVQFGTKS